MEKASSTTQILSVAKKREGFHAKYLMTCKSKNVMPLSDVKKKHKNVHVLDFHADRVRAVDWMCIYSSLFADKTLKDVAIRLRKNNELVLDEIDTFKKASAVTTQPVIYSKFLLTELVVTLQNFLMNTDMLESLTLEGLPLQGHFIKHLVVGLSHNSSIKTLSFARSNLQDEACIDLCTSLKHMMNIETLNFSGCSLGVNGAEAIASVMKFHKIERFSEAWQQSLRYQNVKAESLQGLRNVFMNNNPMVGDAGLEMITEVLREDVWMKNIEMQNCGLTEAGANHIIQCLDFNKTILSFNIAGNPEVPDHLCRHINMNLGGSDNESSDSCDSNNLTTTSGFCKKKVLETVKFLEDQLVLEVFRRKQFEQTCNTLQDQLMESQNKIALQGAFRVPDGFQLVHKDTIERLLKEKCTIPSKSVFYRKRRPLDLKKVKSCVVASRSKSIRDVTKSAMSVPNENVSGAIKKIFIETTIGDTIRETQTPMSGNELLQLFVRKKREIKTTDSTNSAETLKPSFDSLIDSFKRVPQNSDCDSDI